MTRLINCTLIALWLSSTVGAVLLTVTPNALSLTLSDLVGSATYTPGIVPKDGYATSKPKTLANLGSLPHMTTTRCSFPLIETDLGCRQLGAPSFLYPLKHRDFRDWWKSPRPN